MRVRIPSLLTSYTQAGEVEAKGATLGAVVDDLERRYPGIKFRVVDEQDRVRPHIKFFVGESMVNALDHPVGPDQTIQIVGALSGG